MANRIRPANVLDLLPLLRPPQAEVRLDLVRQLLSPGPVERGPLAWLGTDAPPHTLLSWGEQGLQACVQARGEHEAEAWEVGYLAAWQTADVEELWRELLAALGRAAGRQGRQRLLARLPGEGYLELFRQAGFTPYAQEMIMAWEGPAGGEPAPAPPPRAVQPADAWDVQRLYANLTPPIVQQAEGERGPRPGEDAWIWEDDGQVRAYLARRQGRRGVCLRLLLDPAFRQHAPAVLSHGLAGVHPPAYLVVRGYQGELLEVARRLGFGPHAEQALLIRHLAARQPVAQPTPARAVERPLEAAPSAPSVGPAYHRS